MPSRLQVIAQGFPAAAVLGAWVLVDSGLSVSAPAIVRAAAATFGADSAPAAIILTHGHFDHVGSVRQLADRWDAPVYAHPLELPYLTGRSSDYLGRWNASYGAVYKLDFSDFRHPGTYRIKIISPDAALSPAFSSR